MVRATEKPLAAVVVTALVMTACGQIAGLQEPAELDVSAGGGGPGGRVDGASADDVEITPTSIDIGLVTCGTTAANVPSIVIKNRGKTTPKFAVEIPEGSGFELGGPLTGELAPDASVSITVTVKPKMNGDNTAVVNVNAGSARSEIAVKAIGEGGHLEIAPTTANLGPVRRENGGSLDVALTNTGNKPVSLTTVDSSLADFSAVWEGAPAPLAIEPGTTKTMAVKLSSAAVDSPVLDGLFTLHVDGAHCGDVPKLPVQGQRVNQDVTISPAVFGNQNCMTTPTLQSDVVVSNYTSSSISYSAVLRNGATSAFGIVSGASDMIGPGTTATPTTKAVKLGMKAIGTTVGPIDEIVDIEIAGIGPPSGGKRTAAATASVRGVVFTVTPSDSTGFPYQSTRSFTFTNSGNEPYANSTYFIRDSNTTQQPAWWFSFPSVPAGQARTGSVQFNPNYYGNYAGTWTFVNTNGIPICNNAKPTLHVQGSIYD